MADELRREWLAVAADLLMDAAYGLGDRGCNDWRWPEGWTRGDRVEFAGALVRDNERVAPGAELTAPQRQQVADLVRGEFGPPDWWVALFLAKWIREGK